MGMELVMQVACVCVTLASLLPLAVHVVPPTTALPA
jgi:hypothetical protein